MPSCYFLIGAVRVLHQETSIILTKEILTNLRINDPEIRLSNKALKWVKMFKLLNVCDLSSDLYFILIPLSFFILSFKEVFPGLKISNWDVSLPLSEVSALMYFVSIIITIIIIIRHHHDNDKQQIVYYH